MSRKGRRGRGSDRGLPNLGTIVLLGVAIMLLISLCGGPAPGP